MQIAKDTNSNEHIQSPEQSKRCEMSVILIVPDHYNTVHCTVQALQRQTAKQQLELVVVGSSKEKLGFKESNFDGFGSFQVIEIGTFSSTVARTAGVNAAKAPVVAFTEDHSFPDDEWAEALIEKHKEHWTGVGPVFCNVNPDTMTSWASFLMEHGEWITPKSPNTPHSISGNNSSYKRKALLEYGSNLDRMLESEASMQWDMMSKGHKFCVEPKAKMNHLNYSAFWKTLWFRFYSGRQFAARRAHKWLVIQRWFYVLVSPLIPLVRTIRIVNILNRIGKKKLIIRVFPPLFIILGMSGLGEMVGYAFGSGNVMQKSAKKAFHRECYLIERERKQTGDLGSILLLKNNIF